MNNANEITQKQVIRWSETLQLNQWVIEKQTKGLSHADTLLSLPFRGNCMNWVLGHIAEHRDWMLRTLSLPTTIPAETAMLYRRGSDPITMEIAVPTEQLFAYLNTAKASLTETMQKVDLTFLTEIPTNGLLMESHRDKSRIERLEGLLWHETYHMGQLEMLRQLAGTNDNVL